MKERREIKRKKEETKRKGNKKEGRRRKRKRKKGRLLTQDLRGAPRLDIGGEGEGEGRERSGIQRSDLM